MSRCRYEPYSPETVKGDERKLTPENWSEAICATCYIKNRFTSSKKPTLFELWFGEKPLTSGFREGRKSLDNRAEKCILVVYCTGNTYRLMTKKSRRTVVARGFKFDEASLGLHGVKNDYAPLYLEYNDQKDIPMPEE